MAKRVTGAQSVLLALTGIISLSGLALSQGIDWDNGAQFNAESSGFMGPQLLPTELGEDPEIPTADSQPVVTTATNTPAISAPVIALTPEQEQQMRVAYGTYLVSRVGARNAIVSGQVRRIQQVGQSEAVADIVQEVSPENVVEEDALTTASIALEKTTSAITQVETAIIAPVLIPIPAPANLRPILSVQPVSVVVIQPARTVSVDHLVHVDVPNSWPRRLDQVNNVNYVNIAQNNQNFGGNIFLQDWQTNQQVSAQPRQFNNVSGQFPANVMFAGRAN